MFSWGQSIRFIFPFLNILFFLNIKSFKVSQVGYSELSGAFVNRGPTLSRYSLSSSYHYSFQLHVHKLKLVWPSSYKCGTWDLHPSAELSLYKRTAHPRWMIFLRETFTTGNNLGRVTPFHYFVSYFRYFYCFLLFYFLLLLFRTTKSEPSQGKMLLDSSSAVMSLGTEMPALTQKSLLPPDAEPHYTCQSPSRHFSRFFF